LFQNEEQALGFPQSKERCLSGFDCGQRRSQRLLALSCTTLGGNTWCAPGTL